MKRISFKIRHTLADYFEINKAMLRTTIGRWACIAVALAMIAMELFISAPAERNSKLLVVLPWALAIAMIGLTSHWLAGFGAWRREGSKRTIGEIVADDEMIRTYPGNGKGRELPWKDFRAFTRSKNLIILWKTRPPDLLAIPLRDLKESPGAEAAFIEMVCAKLPAKARVGIL